MNPHLSKLTRNAVWLAALLAAALALRPAPSAAAAHPVGEPAFVGEVIRGTTPGSVVNVDLDITNGRELYLVLISRWSGWGDWIEPTLVGRRGTVRLTDLPWKLATSGKGSARVNANAMGHELRVEGKPVQFGIGVYSPSVIVYEIPAGYTRFKARCGLDDEGHGSATFMVFVDNPIFQQADRASDRPASPTAPPNDGASAPPSVGEPAVGSTGEFIEMTGGDRLPGVVEGYVGQPDDPLATAPPHFLVRTTLPNSPVENTTARPLRVCERFVRRIAWQTKPGMPADYTPGTLFSRDGSTIQFRSAQFSSQHIQLLTSDGIRRVPMADIARVDLPRADPWETHFDKLAVLCPNGDGHLIRLNTTRGLVATASSGRSLALPLGQTPQTLRWWVALQPAWALDLLWCDPESIASVLTSRPDQMPVSRLVPTNVVSRSWLGGGNWRWRANRNVQGGPLTCGRKTFSHGYGVHADCELHFSLPAAAVSFQSQVGLDALAGSGGCVRARVYLDSTDNPPLYESPFLVGSARVHNTGRLTLPDANSAKRTLILQVDSAHEGRPPDADPLDIRDMCDWLEPRLQLDPAALRDELPRRARQSITAWQDWQIKDEKQAIGLTPLAICRDGVPERFATGVIPSSGRLVLHRDFNVDRDTHWLIARAAGRSLDATHPTRLTIDIDGESVAEFALAPPAEGQHNEPMAAVPLLPYAGKQIRATVELVTGHREDAVAWTALGVSNASPPILTVWEDAEEVESVDEEPGNDFRLVHDDFHSGQAALRIESGGRCRVKLPANVRIRETPDVGEHRYLRFAFRKFGGGRIALGFDHAESREKLVRYDAGTGPPAYGSARRVWSVSLPPEWIVQTVDLFANYGELDIHAVELAVPDGDHALFDHLYFARAPDDFRWLPPAPSPEETNVVARRALTRVPREKGLPAIVAFDRGNGLTGTGTVVDGDNGYVLTAGHMIAGERTEFDAYLAGGRKVTARRLGLNRGKDVGLLQIDSTDPLPAVEIDFDVHEQYPLDVVYLAIAHARRGKLDAHPAAYLVSVRGLRDGSIWTDFQLADRGRGGPLLDQHGRLIGVHTRRTGDSSEFLYTPSSELSEGWTRLVEGKIWGHWLSGVGPKMGVIVSTRPEGCQITHVFSDSPAATANLKVDDWIRRLDREPVASLADMARLLSSRDPDEFVTLDIRRADRSFPVKLRLMQHRRLVEKEDTE